MNDLAQRLNTIHGIKCLLYADYLLIWTVTPKKKLVPLTEKLLNQTLISLEKWRRGSKVILERGEPSIAHAVALTTMQMNGRGRAKGPPLPLEVNTGQRAKVDSSITHILPEGYNCQFACQSIGSLLSLTT
ncbi:hypothetical protein CEXT_134151 [Caerostris extrusa]|uniref:Reverse transcriptase domain-containing protein n=1 Tax=Caerostris extrusa TaxID=172846 RepID=A0AAV4UGY7_CAEEX|nr:hypothetical protein CEXT_134151 [Caerostris extrusa]